MTQTILVIDDDDPIRRMVATTLERAGFNVVGVSDGLTGLSSVKQRRPDLVIVGLLLPWLMGFDVCRRIRELPGGATLPIIVMSTVMLSDDARREIRDHLGIQHILQKPFPFKELLDAVGALIERSSNEPPYMA